MCAKLEQHRTIGIELIDNWHPRWSEVLVAIEQLGQRDHLKIDAEGWLSARQNLMVAFVDGAVAGHLSFRVQITRGDDERDRPVIEAVLESLGVQPEFCREEIESLLIAAAERRARALRCRQLVIVSPANLGICGSDSSHASI